MPPRKFFPFIIALAGVLAVLLVGDALVGEDGFDEEDEAPLFLPGLAAEYTGSDGVSHGRLDEVVSMSWGTRTPDPRVPAGEFKARWTGRLQVWATGEYQFRFYAVGRVRLSVTGETVLVDERDEPGWLESTEVEIPWGEQPIEIEYEKTGDEAQLSFFWRGPDFDWEPVAVHSLMHAPEHAPDNRFQRGRFLSRALRCVACHDLPDQAERISAPALDKLVGAISPEWIADWLSAAPSEPAAAGDEQIARRMPHFAFSRSDAEAIAAYLVAESSEQKFPDESPKGKPAKGRELFFSLGCLACHRVGELGESGLFGGGDLTTIADKRPAGFFEQWLQDPASLNRDHRMPVFELSNEERSHLAAFLATLKKLSSDSESPSPSPSPADRGGGPAISDGRTDSFTTPKSVIERGRKLAAEYRCQNCHRLPEKSDSAAGSIPLEFTSLDWSQSCAGNPNPLQIGHPAYGLSSEQQEALQVYFAELPRNGRRSAEPLDGKFLMRERNCLGCHSRGKVQGIEEQIQSIAAAEHSLAKGIADVKPPALDSVGDKLHDQMLLDAITTKRKPRRDWLLVRMPKFRWQPGEAQAIADYLRQEDRIPPSPESQQLDVEDVALQAAGERLVTTDGFGCTSCHQIGKVKPTHTSHGVHGPDLSMIGGEVRYPWFLRWVHNPTRISPRMEMPAVKIPIRGVLDGKLDEQHAAVWAVLNQPDFEPPKPNPVRVIRQRNGEQSTSQPLVVIDNVEAGEHSFVKPLLVALANRHNVLFDLERFRLAGWWQGDTARQRLRGKYWYWEAAGTPVVAASQGESEIALQINGQRVFPAIDPAFPPEADQWQMVGTALTFDTRLEFLPDGDWTAAPIELDISQTFQPLLGEETLGFARSVEIVGVTAGTELMFNAVPGEEVEVDQSRRIASSTEGRFSVVSISENARFQMGVASGQMLLAHDSDGIVRVDLEYRSAIPSDRYLKPIFPPIVVEQEKLRVVPGFDATRLPLPEEIAPTALAWDKQGQLLFTTLKGELWQARDTDEDAIEDELNLLADGLSAPFGLATLEEDGLAAIDVADKTALLRMTDTDGDGRIDRTRTVASGWGHSTDYHGWVTGLPRDDQGNYYAVVTNRNGPPAHLRGRVMKLEKLDPPTEAHRQYEVKPLAIGLRFAVGIARNRGGDLFVTDNQGQYNPFNELNHIVEGGHYGFFNLKGLEDTPEVGAMPRRGPTVGIPHPWARSVNGICFLETPKEILEETGMPLFGPFEGHLLGCESTTRELIRVSLQRVGDRYQGAAYPLTIPPPRGTSSLLRPLVARVAPNGDVLVGSVHDSAWGAGRNVGEIVKLKFHGDLPVGIAEMRAIDSGFQLDFTAAVDRKKANNKDNYVLTSYRCIPTPAYGGPNVDLRTEKIESVELSEDAKLVTLALPELRKGFVYELRVRNLTPKGEQFHPAEAFYSMGPLE